MYKDEPKLLTLEDIARKRKENFTKFKTERINTSGLDIEPHNKETLMSFMFLQTSFWIDDARDWDFDPMDPEIEIPWLLRMVRKRIIGEKLKIEITQKAYLMIYAIISDPGHALYVLHRIGNHFEKIKAKTWLVNSKIIHHLFGKGFPTEEAFNKWWDGQKIPQSAGFDNRVDVFPDEWRRQPISEPPHFFDIFLPFGL